MVRIIVIILFIFPMTMIQGQSDSLKVLFIGNSYTYFWNLPQQVAAMAQSQGVPLMTRQSTNGGVTLANHWKGERDLETQSKIKSGQFNRIVLQDNSLWPLMHADTTLKYGKKLGQLIKQNGGRPIMYLTWGRKGNPLMQPINNKVYRQVAEAIDAEVAPVGPAWQKATTLDPSIELYDPDGSHPSAIGTYLTACVFYGVLTGNSPVGLPIRLAHTDEDGEKIYLNILPNRLALFCQQVAWETIQEWNNH